jgi:hypothetical protein
MFFAYKQERKKTNKQTQVGPPGQMENFLGSIYEIFLGAIK